jgi:hypothetical protein
MWIKEGFGMIILNGSILPDSLAGLATGIVSFYVAVVYLISVQFKAIMVPITAQIFITDAPHTEDILNICQAVFIYRF